MRVRVMLFAAASELAGADHVALDVSESATIAEIQRALSEAFPSLADLLQSSMFAVNQKYAAPNDVVNAVDEVACIPPVSGG